MDVDVNVVLAEYDAHVAALTRELMIARARINQLETRLKHEHEQEEVEA